MNGAAQKAMVIRANLARKGLEKQFGMSELLRKIP
jgi:hypothetical protein